MVKSGRKWRPVVAMSEKWGCFRGDERVNARAKTPHQLQKGFHAAGQLSGDGGREGSGENSGRLPGRVAQVGNEILRHQRHRRLRPDLSDEGVGRDRKEAGKTFLSQPREAAISGAHQLLRASRRGGWAGAHFNSTRTAGIGADEGRSGRAGLSHVPASLEPCAIPGTTEA